MDAEWGLGMRLDDGFSFPYNITLGAIEMISLVFGWTENWRTFKKNWSSFKFCPCK